MSYPLPCHIGQFGLVYHFFLVIFVRCHDLLTKRINSWRDMLCRPALLCACAMTVCTPFNRSSSLLLSFVPTERRCITTSSYSWLLCHSCRVSFMSVILPRIFHYRQLTTYMLTSVGKPAPWMAPSKGRGLACINCHQRPRRSSALPIKHTQQHVSCNY